MTTPFPEYLTAASRAAGFEKASDLARATGIGESQISRWLRGANVPDIENLRKLAAALGKPLLELTVAAGHISPAEARMKDSPAPPPIPVGARMDPDLAADLAEASPEALDAVRALLKATKPKA